VALVALAALPLLSAVLLPLYVFGEDSHRGNGISPVAEQISAISIARRKGREPPYGKALDLGCPHYAPARAELTR
jgi:hypothetical protein